jgi:hypothetical protein
MTCRLIPVALVLAGSLLPAWGQTITRIAGSGQSGFAGDGADALAARFDGPRSVALDAAGNLIIADTTNDRIRRVAPNGVVTTIAGTGDIFLDAPNGTQATQQFLWRPSSVVVNPADGVIYVSDTLRDVVRRILPDGTMHIVAGTTDALSTVNGDGGPARSARLKWPRGLALDSQGNLYIADSLNSVVRKVTPEGTILNVAGVYGQEGYNGDNIAATTARLKGPIDVAVDAAGNLYIAEGSSFRIRKVGTDGIITTYAGTGTAGFSGDTGPAKDARISNTEYLATDRGGNLYLFDGTNNRIRRVTPDGKIYTIAGTGQLGSTGDGGNATAARFGGLGGDILPLTNGDLYVVDSGNHALRRISYNCNYAVTPEVTYYDAAPASGSVNVSATAGCIWGPFSDSFWLTAGATSPGAQTVNFTVAENFGFERTGFLFLGSAQTRAVQRGTRAVFSDVTAPAYYFDPINVLHAMGIPIGTATNPNRYFPDDPMTRSQMAVFMVRAIFGGDTFQFPAIPYFTDVQPNHPQFRWIQKLRELGLTSGCTVSTYCPNDTVTRGQMAKFLVTMRYGTSHSFNVPPVPYFNDVTYQHPFYSWIQELRQMSITTGTSSNPPLYSPESPVTRGQMAVFILRNINAQYLPAGTPYLSEVLTTGSGSSLTLLITGQNTRFDATSTVHAGTGVTVTSIQRISAQHLIVNVTVDPSAPRGPRPVVVRTGTEDASKLVGLTLN